MYTQAGTNGFRAFVELTKAAIPEVAAGFHGNRVIADAYLLYLAARNALVAFPQDMLPQLFVGVVEHASPDVQAELAALLLSFHEVDHDTMGSYLRDRSDDRGPRYRFELVLDEPDWLSVFLPRDYANGIVIRVVVQYLVRTGDWELPEKIARRRARATASPQPQG